MPGPDDVSLGEVARRLDDFRRDTRTDFEALERRLASLQFVTPEVYAADKRAAADREKTMSNEIAALRGQLQWLARTFGGAVIVAVVGLLFAWAQAGGPG